MALINYHDKKTNVLVQIMIRNSRKNLRKALVKICLKPGTLINPTKRASFAFRLWVKTRKTDMLFRKDQ